MGDLTDSRFKLPQSRCVLVMLAGMISLFTFVYISVGLFHLDFVRYLFKSTMLFEKSISDTFKAI